MHPNYGPSIDPLREKRLLAALRNHPQLFERFEAILALSQSEGAKPLTADAVEALLIEELRQLGNDTLQQWATGAEEQAARQLEAKTPGARLRKKTHRAGGAPLAR